MKNSLSIYKIIALVAMSLIAMLKPVGFDPDSKHYYEWITSETYSDMNVEPLFKIITDIAIFLVGNMDAYYFTNAFFVNAMIFLLYKISRQFNSKPFLLMFFGFCYVSLVLTQIRFGLGLLLFVYSYILWQSQKRIKSIIFVSAAIASHYSILLMLFLTISVNIIKNLKISLLNIFGLILALILIYFINQIYNNMQDYIGFFDFGSLEDKVADNIANSDQAFGYFKTSSFFVIISLSYLYIKCKSRKNLYEIDLLFLLGATSIAFSMNPALHIRIFQLFVVLLPLIAYNKFQITLRNDGYSILIFYIYPILYLLNDVFRNNFFGV